MRARVHHVIGAIGGSGRPAGSGHSGTPHAARFLRAISFGAPPRPVPPRHAASIGGCPAVVLAVARKVFRPIHTRIITGARRNAERGALPDSSYIARREDEHEHEEEHEEVVEERENERQKKEAASVGGGWHDTAARIQ